MATDFPTSIDSYTRPTASDTMATTDVEGPTVIDNLYDSVEALETKVGANSSAVATSLDYLVKNSSSSNPGHRHTLAHGATDVTASAAELNILDDATVNTTELNYLDGTTLGTVVASKVLAVDSNKDLSGFGTVNFDNAEKITFDDSGGTARDTLQVDSSNNIIIGDSSNFNEVQIYTMCKCHVTLSADQDDIPDATPTKILFDSEVFDVGGDFASNKFTAPVTGYYQVNAGMSFEAGTVSNGKTILIYIYVDGGAYESLKSANTLGVGQVTSCTVSGLVYLAAGSYLEVYVYHNEGAATPDIDKDYTYLTVHLDSV